MGAWTGGVRLTLLAVRRDRISVPAWVLGIAAFVLATTALFQHDLAHTSDVVRETRLVVENGGMRLLGLASGPTVGGYMLHREYVTLAVLAALMSTFLVVRHTRQNEELGRAEVLGSAVVGRRAALSAAVSAGVAANVVLALVLGGAIALAGPPLGGALVAGAAVAEVGLVFTGVAAVTSQVASTTRGASGLAGGVLALAFLASGLGNMLGSVDHARLTVRSGWPVWLSPIGWGQQMRPFGGDHVWPLLLALGSFAALVLVAFALVGRRDVGRGLWPEHRARRTAPASLLHAGGLPWRLQRPAFVGWAIGLLGFGLVLGSLSRQISTVGGETAKWYTRTGGTHVVVDAFLTSIVAMGGMFVAVYVVQVLLRVHVDEAGGTAESLLATALSRFRWLLGHLVVALVGASALLLVFGVSMGVAAGAVLGGVGHHTSRMGLAGLVQLPAVMVVGGLVVAVAGTVPRWATPASWVLLIVFLVLGPMFGPGLGLPAWAQDLSPFTHVPKVPAATVGSTPLLALVGTGVLLAGAGLLAMRHRDLRLPA